MKKLYEKNELTFAIIWIVVYCGLQSLYCGRTEDCLPCWMQCLLKLQAVYLCCCVWCFVVLRQ